MAFRTLQAPSPSGTGFRPLEPSKPTSKGLVASIKEDFSRRNANVQASKTAAQKGEQSHLEGIFQAIGQSAGFVGDVATRVAGKAASAVVPDVIEKPVRAVGRAALETVVASKPVQKGVETYQGFKAEHPRAAKNIESGLNILSIAPSVKGAQVGAKGAAKTASTVAKPVIKTIDKATDALGDLPRRMEQINLRLTPVQKQNLGKKLNDVTNFIADQEIVGDQAKKFTKVSEITEGFEDTLQTYLKTDLGDPEISTLSLKMKLQDLKRHSDFRNERDLPLITKQIDSMVSRLDSYGHRIKVTDLNELKRSTYREAYNKAGDKVSDWVEHDMGDIFKTTVEDVAEKSGKPIAGMKIGDFNKRYGTAIEARKLLKVSQSRAQIGLVGKIVGTLIGSTLGTAVGGPAGSAVGLFVGPKVGEVVAGSAARSALGAGIKKLKRAEPSMGLSVKDVSGIPKTVTPQSVGSKMDMTDVKILETYLNNPTDIKAFEQADKIITAMKLQKADRVTQLRFLKEAIAYARDRFTKTIPIKILR